jgi:hypothetical protein
VAATNAYIQKVISLAEAAGEPKSGILAYLDLFMNPACMLFTGIEYTWFEGFNADWKRVQQPCECATLNGLLGSCAATDGQCSYEYNFGLFNSSGQPKGLSLGSFVLSITPLPEGPTPYRSPSSLPPGLQTTANATAFNNNEIGNAAASSVLSVPWLLCLSLLLLSLLI